MFQGDEGKYYFGTKGIFPEDVILISKIMERYGAKFTYHVGENEFNSVNELIEFCLKDKSFMFSIIGRISPPHGPFFALLIGGAISSWTVSIPKEFDPVNTAMSKQLFQDVKECLEKRRAFIPSPPWHVARNVLTVLPLAFLTGKIIFPDLPYAEDNILVWTITAAIANYFFAWIERKRWNKSAIIFKKSYFKKLYDRWPEALFVTATTIVGGVAVELLKNWFS